MGARSDMQRALGGAVRHGRVDAGKIDDRRAERRRKRPRPGRIGRNRLAVLDDDGAGDEHRAGREAGRQTAGDAEADDGAGVRGGAMQILREARAVAAARQRVNPRPGGDLRLRLEPRDGDHPRIRRERPYIANGVVS